MAGFPNMIIPGAGSGVVSVGGRVVGKTARWTVSQYNIHDTERMVFGSVTHYPELVHKQDGDEWTAYVLCRGACLEAHYPTAEAAIDAAEQWIRERTAPAIAPPDPWQAMPCGHARGEIHPAECGDVALNREQLVKRVAEMIWDGGGLQDVAREVVDAILPQVTTVEELEALPVPTLLRGDDGQVWQRTMSGWDCLSEDGSGGAYPSAKVAQGPTTVVWRSES